MGTVDGAAEWAADLVADSEAAMRQLCAVVADGLDDPAPMTASLARFRPLVGAAGESAGVLVDGLRALTVAVVGANDLARTRMEEILETLPEDLRPETSRERGILESLGQAVLGRIFGER